MRRTMIGSHGFSEDLVAEHGDVGFAGRQAMLRKQFGNGAVRRPFFAQLNDDLFGGNEVLEFLWTARCEFRDGSADGDGIKGGHRRE